jgi:hypothetical protein
VSSKRDQGRSVWIFNHYAVGPGVPGGTRHYDIGRELAKRGWQVTVFSAVYPRQESPVRGQSAETGGDSGPTRVCDGVSFIRVPALHRGNANAMRALSVLSRTPGAMRVARGLVTPDVTLESFSVHPFASWITWWLDGKVGCRNALETGDRWPETIV